MPRRSKRPRRRQASRPRPPATSTAAGPATSAGARRRLPTAAEPGARGPKARKAGQRGWPGCPPRPAPGRWRRARSPPPCRRPRPRPCRARRASAGSPPWPDRRSSRWSASPARATGSPSLSMSFTRMVTAPSGLVPLEHRRAALQLALVPVGAGERRDPVDRRAGFRGAGQDHRLGAPCSRASPGS